MIGGMILQSIELLNVRVDDLDMASAVGVLAGLPGAGEPSRLVTYANAHTLTIAVADPALRQVMNDSLLVICEGHGVRLGARLAGQPVPSVIQTVDWIDDLLDAFARDGRSIFLLGDEPGVAARAAERMRQQHPGLVIAGAHHGFFDAEADSGDIVAAIDAARPDFVLLGMGSPRQELWAANHLRDRDISGAIALGALFRWYAGAEPAPPKWVRDRGLWWAHRLARHPVRHFRRYVVGLPRFLWYCFRQRRGTLVLRD